MKNFSEAYAVRGTSALDLGYQDFSGDLSHAKGLVISFPAKEDQCVSSYRSSRVNAPKQRNAKRSGSCTTTYGRARQDAVQEGREQRVSAYETERQHQRNAAASDRRPYSGVQPYSTTEAWVLGLISTAVAFFFVLI